MKEERENIRVLAEEKELELEEIQAENERSSRISAEAREELEIVGKMVGRKVRNFVTISK